MKDSLELPETPAAWAHARWDDIRPCFQALAERPLSPANVEAWLAEWSRLESLLSEAAARAMIAYTVETENPEREAAHLRFSTEILPRADEESVRLARRLLSLGYSRPDLETVIERFRTQIEIFREANVPLAAELEEYGARYQKITGGMMVEWEGRELTLPQMQPYLRSLDRPVRERAFRLLSGAFLARRDDLADLFTRMFRLRQDMAANAGFANYRDYAFRAKFRFDYTPADVERFHQSVEQVVTPAVERLRDRRRQRLGVSSLRPWDTQVDPFGLPALVPFQDVGQLERNTERVMQRLDPVLGEQFGTMVREGLLDLGSRKGKAPGGYCETLHQAGRPYIFMNAAGTLDDVMTLFHEAGHAFHAFAAHPLPLIWQRHPGMEAAELASMSMELLAGRYLGREDGGFFTPMDLARARIEHLEDILASLTHIASVDAFQTWIYTSGEGHDPAARDRAWVDIRSRFERGVDWSGLEEERTARWYRQLHIFLYPFYYIEYGIAQLGALQVWRNTLADPMAGLAAYRNALALGATASLPAMYQAAGARLIFDADAMRDLVALVEAQLALAEGELARHMGGVGGEIGALVPRGRQRVGPVPRGR